MSKSSVGLVRGAITGVVVLVLVLVVVVVVSTEAVRFEIKSGHTKCVAEDIKSNSMTVGKYSIINPNEGHPLPDSHKLTVTVTSSHGTKYHHSDQVASGQFAFTAAEAWDYVACFFAKEHTPEETFTVDFDWRSGIASKDWTSVAKKGSVEVMELELKKLQDTVTSIQDEMHSLRQREEEMQELNRGTDSKMSWLSFLSLAVCSSVAGLQYWHLKSYFQKKKII